jgi:hypothetical protein
MIDAEVLRLRRLRVSALHVRAVAKALARNRAVAHDVLLHRGACASWRIARAVSGRLRAHPYQRYQKDAGLAVILRNSVLAMATAFRATNRTRALTLFEAELRHIGRELDDARALTWSADLSDTFGRSQIEIRSLLSTLQTETGGAGLPAATPQRREFVPVTAKRSEYGDAAGGDWPYLAF